MTKQLLHLDDSTENVIKYYSDMVYRIAFTRTGTRYDADEIYQEVFLRYVKKQPVFTDEEHRKAWLIRVTINCSNKFWNLNLKRKTEPLGDSIIFELKCDLNLYGELQKLPLKYRQVIHLFYYEDMSIEGISQVLKRKKSTVRTQLTRGRAMLKSFMREEDYV